MRIIQNMSCNSIWIGQPFCTEGILSKLGMDNAKSVRTPVSTGQKLMIANQDLEKMDENLYQSAIGSLLCLAT